MANYQIDENSTILFYGKTYNAQQFANAYLDGDTIENAIGGMQILLNEGRATLCKGQQSKEQATFEKVAKEEEIKNKAYEHEHYEEMNKDYNADKKREGKAIYDHIEFDFPYPLKAQEFEDYIHKTLRVKDTEISVRNGQCMLKVYNITDAELNAMSRVYKTQRFTENTVGLVGKSTKFATDTINYGATKIVAPVIQVGARAGASIFRTILVAAAKTAGTLVSATAQGVKSASYEIKHDPDVLKGSKDLLETGDAIRQKLNFNARGGSGIRISQ